MAGYSDRGHGRFKITMKKQVSISESEWTVMKVVWSESPRTLQDILSSLKTTAWSTTTIQDLSCSSCKKRSFENRAAGEGLSVLSEGLGGGMSVGGGQKLSGTGVRRLPLPDGQGLCKKRQCVEGGA